MVLAQWKSIRHIFRMWHKVRLEATHYYSRLNSTSFWSCLFLPMSACKYWAPSSTPSLGGGWHTSTRWNMPISQCWSMSALQRSSSFSHSLPGLAHTVPWQLRLSACHVEGVLWASMMHVKWCDAGRCSWCVLHWCSPCWFPGKYSEKQAKKSLALSTNATQGQTKLTTSVALG